MNSKEVKEIMIERLGSVLPTFRYLKSRNSFKAIVGDFVSELQLYYDARNVSEEYIGFKRASRACMFVIGKTMEWHTHKNV